MTPEEIIGYTLLVLAVMFGAALHAVVVEIYRDRPYESIFADEEQFFRDRKKNKR